ncbi:MAG: FtsW/RodA/SpoVE family cell cycle protein, partial [Phycisphaerales bacterium]
ASVALSALGIYAIDLADSLAAPTRIGELSPVALKQTVFLAIGLTAGALVALPHFRFIGYIAWPALLAVVGLLVFLLIPFVPEWLVTPRNGTRGWINMGPLDFQPSEVAKIAFVLVVAWDLRHRHTHRKFLGLIRPGLIAFVPVALITLQPDLGTASLFIPSLFAMLLSAGAKLRHLTVIVLIAMMAGPAMYPLLRDHQKTRFIALVKQIQGDRTTAYDINYPSFTAQTLAGAGRVAGNADERARALVHFNRLPEAHNDMGTAVIMNRFGLAGGIGLLALYVVWIAGALLCAGVCKHPFGRLTIVGLSGFIAAQAVVNVGMTVGLLPIIGVTLPFVSYGGSSMLTCWMMTGLIFNIAMRPPAYPVRPSFEYDRGHGTALALPPTPPSALTRR